MVCRKLSFALMTLPSGENSITAIARPKAFTSAWFSCSLMIRAVMSVATLITLCTCRSAPITGM
ncbi:hypothetical protein D3C78_1895670 [compost metagenome]